MILSDRDIKKALAEGRIAIEPLDDPDLQIQPASVDLRMGTRFILFRHAMTPFIDPSFEGNITLELSNVGRMPVALHPNMRVCQISFEPLSTPAERPYGAGRGSKYQGQVGPTASRIHRDAK